MADKITDIEKEIEKAKKFVAEVKKSAEELEKKLAQAKIAEEKAKQGSAEAYENAKSNRFNVAREVAKAHSDLRAAKRKLNDLIKESETTAAKTATANPAAVKTTTAAPKTATPKQAAAKTAPKTATAKTENPTTPPKTKVESEAKADETTVNYALIIENAKKAVADAEKVQTEAQKKLKSLEDAQNIEGKAKPKPIELQNAGIDLSNASSELRIAQAKLSYYVSEKNMSDAKNKKETLKNKLANAKNEEERTTLSDDIITADLDYQRAFLEHSNASLILSGTNFKSETAAATATATTKPASAKTTTATATTTAAKPAASKTEIIKFEDSTTPPKTKVESETKAPTADSSAKEPKDKANEISFYINCFNNENNLAGVQNVKFSSEKANQSNITFTSEKDLPFVVDLENRLFKVKNEDKTNIVAIENVSMDYDQNLTFTISGSKTKYRITPFALEIKKDKDFEIERTFSTPLNIVLPENIFQHVKSGVVEVKGFPYQAFEALNKVAKKTTEVETFTDSSNLLHLVKSNGMFYIGRGQKLIPISSENCKLFNNPDGKSVFGVTLGSKNGLGGKQVKGIAFEVDTDELEDIHSFLDNSKIKIDSINEYKKAPIGYSMVKKQSDLGKDVDTDIEFNLTGETSSPSGTPSGGSGGDPDGFGGNPDGGGFGAPSPSAPSSPDPSLGVADPSATDGLADTTEEDKKPTTNPTTADSKKDEDKDKDKAKEKMKHVDISTSIFGVVAGFLALGLISGAFLSPFAWFLFFLCAFAASTGAKTSFDLKHKERIKLSKLEKARVKLYDKEKQGEKIDKKIEKIQGKLESSTNPKKNQKLGKKLGKLYKSRDKVCKNVVELKDKIDDIKEKEDKKSGIIPKDTSVDDAVDKDLSKTTTTHLTDDKAVAVDKVTPAAAEEDKKATTTGFATVEAYKSAISSSKSSVYSDISKAHSKSSSMSEAETNAIMEKLNTEVSDIACCNLTKGLTDKELAFRNACVDFKNSYIAASTANENYAKATDKVDARKELDNANRLLSNAIKELFNISQPETTRAVVKADEITK